MEIFMTVLTGGESYGNIQYDFTHNLHISCEYELIEYATS